MNILKVKLGLIVIILFFIINSFNQFAINLILRQEKNYLYIILLGNIIIQFK